MWGADFRHCNFPERGFSAKDVGGLPVNKYTKVRPKAKSLIEVQLYH